MDIWAVPRYVEGNRCIFRSRTIPSVRDGQLCQIIMVVPREQWLDTRWPQYAIKFADGGGNFGAVEEELSPV